MFILSSSLENEINSIVFFCLVIIHQLHAQGSEASSAIRGFGGFSQDFPGLNGYTIGIEYNFPLINHFEGGIGLKHADMTGFPRTKEVQEYTRATSIDFIAYWLPLQSEVQTLRIGLGYSFSFYNVKRAYPLIVGNGADKITTWPAQMHSGRTGGACIIADYILQISGTSFSAGMRGALYKAYDQTYFIGPVIGYKL